MCCKNGGKASGKHRNAIEMNTTKTISLAVVTEEIVPGDSFTCNLKRPIF